MAKRISNESPISEVLKHIIENNNLEKGLNQVSVADAWKSLMGNGVNHYTRDVILKGSTLYVQLNSSVLREELTYGKQKIITMINEELGAEIVKDVVLK